MSRLSDEDTLQLLRRAIPVERSAPPADLWARVRRQIDQGSRPPSVSTWVLVAALALLCLAQPALLGILLLHF